MIVSLIVPVMKNFKGLAQLLHSVESKENIVTPIIIDNWTHNSGVAAAWNQGLRKAWDSDAAIIANDDVIFTPGTIDALCNGLAEYDLATGWNTRDLGDFGKRGPDYCCFAVRPEMFVRRFGWFDEKFYPAYFEDNDMAYRIDLLGGRQGPIKDAMMFHAGSVTQNMDGPVVDSPTFENNRNYYINKWGGEPGQETYTEPFGGMEVGVL